MEKGPQVWGCRHKVILEPLCPLLSPPGSPYYYSAAARGAAPPAAATAYDRH